MTAVDHEYEAEKAEYRRDTTGAKPLANASREMKVLVIGADPAGKAGDNTAVVLRIGSERHILRQPFASAFIELANEHRPSQPQAESAPVKDMAAALEDAVDSLKYVQTAHPEASGWGVRAERIRKAEALLARYRNKPAAGTADASFQARVKPWMDACFGPAISADKAERNHRFLEEALELVQASGCTREECLQLVDYVFGRPQGDVNQEVGGVMVTLAAHCLAHGADMHEAGEVELARIWGKIDQIRAKQAAKPRGSALPISPSYLPAPKPEEDDYDALADADELMQMEIDRDRG